MVYFIGFQLVEQFLSDNVKIEGTGPEVIQSQIYIGKCKLLCITRYYYSKFNSEWMTWFYVLLTVFQTYSRTSVARTLMAIYHGCFELVLDSFGKNPIAANLG